MGLLSILMAKQDFPAPGGAYLYNGSLIKNMQVVYEMSMGQWFYVVLFGAILLALYVRTQNFGYVAFAGFLGTAVFWVLPDFSHPFIYALSALGLGLLMFSFYGKRNSPYA